MPMVRPLLAAVAAGALAAALLGHLGAAGSARSGSGPGLQHQGRRLGGLERSAELKLHMCAVPFAGSTGRFVLSFPSNPETGQYELIPGMQEFYVKRITIAGPPPTGISISASTKDGLCLLGLSLDGIEAQGGLPVWLDNPCIGNANYAGIHCETGRVWQLPTTTSTSTITTATVTTTTRTSVTTTRSTTTLTATTTVTTTTATTTTATTTTATTTTATTTTATTTTTITATMTTSATSTTTSTTTSSSTVSSTTSSTTATATTTTATATTSTTTSSTTSTTTLYVVLAPLPVPEMPLVAFTAAISPPAFFDELHAELDINIKWTLDKSHQLSVFEGPIAQAVTRFVGLAPPSSMRCSLRQPNSETLVASLDMRIQPGTDLSAEDVKELLSDPMQWTRLNAILALIALPAAGGPMHGQPMDTGPALLLGDREADVDEQESLSLSSNSSAAFRITCQEGAVFCCVRAVVDSIVHNAGVVHAYRHYFILAMLLVAAVGLVWTWVAFPCPCKYGIQSEEERGRLVMPIFAIAIAFQAMLMAGKSVEKYYMLVNDCKRDLPLGTCPPSPSAMVVEVLVFGGGLPVSLAAFLAWWHRRWRTDCRVERLQRKVRRHVVSPMESILRRTEFFACHEVRETDRASRTEHILTLVLSVQLSLAVTLTSFFALQRYSFPSGLTAWFPYKLVYELVIACGLKIAMRKVVRSKLLGSFTFAFLCSSIALVGTLNTWLWVTIGRTFLKLERGFDTWTFMRLLDICAGAGIVNCILSPLSFSFSMYLFSAYVYEPKLRYQVKRSVHLTNPEVQVTEVTALLEKDEDEDSEGAWEVAGVRTSRGEPVRLPAPLVDESSEGEEEGATCMVPTSSSRSSRGATAHWASSLVGVAKAQPNRSQPLIVDLRRKDSVACTSRLVFLCDLLFSVDKNLPVMRRSSRDLSELSMEDEDDYESSDTDGPSLSPSESSGTSGTGTESSEEGLSRPLRSGGWRFGRV